MQLKDIVPKMFEDLTLPNHLSGLRKKYLQLLFDSTRDLMTVRRTLLCASTRHATCNAQLDPAKE